MAESKMAIIDLPNIKDAFISLLCEALMIEREDYLIKRGVLPDVIIIPYKFVSIYKLQDILDDKEAEICGLKVRFNKLTEKIVIYNEMLIFPKIDFSL